MPTVPDSTPRLKLPDPMIELSLRVVVRPVGLEESIVTFPPNPFSAPTVIVEAPVSLMFSEMEDGLAEREKSTAVMRKVEV